MWVILLGWLFNLRFAFVFIFNKVIIGGTERERERERDKGLSSIEMDDPLKGTVCWQYYVHGTCLPCPLTTCRSADFLKQTFQVLHYGNKSGLACSLQSLP